MILYPAIDLRDGRVVRLTEGDFDRMTVYGDDPLAVARGFAAAGATHLHVVDLDGAKEGAPRNAAVLRTLCAQSGLWVQTGGGLRTPERVEAALALGVGRVILGTAALEDPVFLAQMVAQHGEKVAVGVDARDGMVATAGWQTVSSEDAMDFCVRLQDLGVTTVIYTDIARDGRMIGTNLDAYRRLAKLLGLQIIASGGISSYEELATLRDMGMHGAILGKALYEGRLTLEKALAVAEGGDL